MTQIGRKLGNGLGNAAIFIVFMGIGLVVLEFASRVLYPLPPGTKFLDENGDQVSSLLQTRSPQTLRPNMTYRQISPDFDAIIRIGSMGLRVPEPQSTPEIIFLGDSFTFGQGLTDDQTFPAIFCSTIQAECANLGFPGTGTFAQAAILEMWLEKENWRPVEVKHFVFAMASAITAGNDLYDTVVETYTAEVAGFNPSVDGPIAAREDNGIMEVLISNRQIILSRSNLARILAVQVAPMLRSWYSREASPSNLTEGIEAMSKQIARIKNLSEIYGFRYTVYIIHPMQDLSLNTHSQTAEAIRQAVAGAGAVIDTAPAMLDDPNQYYFPFDGHFNAKGAQAIADFLLSRR